MLQELRAWLNGDREYFSGVVLYAKVGDNDALKKLFAKGKTDYCYERLQNELLIICKDLKANESSDRSSLRENADSLTANAGKNSGTTTNSGTNGREDRAAASTSLGSHHHKGNEESTDSLLFKVSKQEADKTYKEVMNLRAELFALARPDNFSDVNTPDRIAQRSKLAVNIAEGFKRVSQLYDKADYVKLHGRLPADAVDDDEELQPDNIPDHLVKLSLDNLRKNVNKIKKREQTPERMQLLQTHEGNIKRLEARWLLLQPAK